MGLFDNVLAGLVPDLRGASAVRERRTAVEGSPVWQLRLAAIAGGAGIHFNPEGSLPMAARKYFPLDWLEVVNDDTVDLNVTVNGVDTYMVPAGTIRTVSGGAIRLVYVANVSGVASTINLVTLGFQRQRVDSDIMLREALR